MGLAILLSAKSCCRLLWEQWLHPLHLLGPVLLECWLQLTSLSSMIELQPPLLCEGCGGHPLCPSGDSSVLMDLHWPCSCTAQSSILSIGSVSVALLWGHKIYFTPVFENLLVIKPSYSISCDVSCYDDLCSRVLGSLTVGPVHTNSTGCILLQGCCHNLLHLIKFSVIVQSYFTLSRYFYKSFVHKTSVRDNSLFHVMGQETSEYMRYGHG